MKKKTILIIFMVLICCFIYTNKGICFDYEKYKSSSLIKINERALKDAKSHEGGYEFYLEHYKIQIILNQYPNQINDRTAEILKYYWQALPTLLKEEYRKMFSYEISIEENGQKFVLVFQEQLIPSLKNEVKLNDFVDLYIILGVHDVSQKSTIFLVNEFSAVKPEEKDIK